MNNTIKKLKEESVSMFPQIRAWAKERGITESKNPFVQSIKLYEEYGELCGSALKHKEDELKDAIGDIIVVLINLNAINNINLEDYLEQYDSELIMNELNVCVASISYFCGKIMHSKDIEKTAKFSNNIIGFLDLICENYNFDIFDCLNLAWNEIKDRKGKNVDGNFIKD